MNLLRILKTGTWKIPCALLLAGVLALACVQCSVRSLVYLPPQPKDKTAYLEKRAAWEPHRRTFHHNGAKLSGWLIEKKGQPLLVYYGGNAMDISMMLPYLDRFPHAKLLVNYRGYGLSTGSPTEQDIMGDSLAILDSVLKETGRTPDDVILVGQSLGSGVATQVASVRHVKKLVLLVPFDSLLETARGLFPYLPVRLLLPDHFRSDLAAPKVACPVSILAAGADEVIPPHHAKRLRCNAPRHLIELRQVSYITCLSASSVQGVCIDSASPLQAASRSPQSTVSSSSLTTPSRSILSLASASRCITLARSLAG